MSFSTNQPVNERIIYVIIAEGQIVRAYASYAMAVDDLTKLKAAKPTIKMAPPVSVKMLDNQAINSKGFDQVKAAW